MDVRYLVTRHLYRPLSLPAASMLARTQVTPIQVTWGSACLALAGATAFGFGSYILGAGLAFVSVITDCIDGDLARMTGRTSRSGAFLDSVLDRWMDAALILGLGYSDLTSYGAVAGLALVGSMVTSYTRARAQSLGTDCPDGIGGRDSRLLILILCALFKVIFVGLLVVAILGAITSVHRMIVAGRALSALDRRDEGSERPDGDPALGAGRFGDPDGGPE